MAQQMSVLSVFVASPDDVSQERQALKEVVEDLNALWKEHKRIQLHLVRWETHTYPSVGKDAQSIINEQIQDDYDIFIGIMWKKSGTPTGRAPSGTQEEFERAHKRYMQNPQSLRIMFYFRAGTVDITEVDPEELLLVRKFRDQLKGKGVYYSEFRDSEDFRNKVRMHLSRHVEDWGTKWGSLPQTVPAEAVPTTLRDDLAPDESLVCPEEQEGFLDLIEIGRESFDSLKKIAERITASTELLGEKMNLRTQEMKRVQGVMPGQFNLKAVKRVCTGAADDLQQFAKLLEAEVPDFGDTFFRGIDAFARSTSLLPDFAAEGDEVARELTSIIDAVSSLHNATIGSRSSLAGLRSTIAMSPRATTYYNRAKRRAVAVLDRFIAESDSAIKQMQETKKIMQDLRDSAKSRGT